MTWPMVILKFKKKRTIADKVLKDETFKITSDQKYDGYQRGLASMVFKFFDKKSQGSGHRFSSASLVVNNDIKQNIQLVDELHKPIVRKKKEKCILHLEIILGVLI